MRWTKAIAPIASLALLLSFHQTTLRADDAAAPAAEGKAKLTVTVVDSAGKPVAGAEVDIYAAVPKAKVDAAGATTQPADGAKKPRPTALMTGETGADGTVALAKVPNGKFRVAARLKGTGNGTSPVVIADDKDGTITITLKPRTPKAGT